MLLYPGVPLPYSLQKVTAQASFNIMRQQMRLAGLGYPTLKICLYQWNNFCPTAYILLACQATFSSAGSIDQWPPNLRHLSCQTPMGIWLVMIILYFGATWNVFLPPKCWEKTSWAKQDGNCLFCTLCYGATCVTHFLVVLCVLGNIMSKIHN